MKHECNEMLSQIGSRYFVITVEYGEHGGMLKQESFATAQDVRAGEADAEHDLTVN